jgi:hypothetical protein
MPSKKKLRFPVPCAYCGQPLTAKTHTWDHYVPRSAGGTSEPANLVHACGNCNSRKGSQPAEEFLAQPIPPARPPKVKRQLLSREQDLDRIRALPWVQLVPARCQFCKQPRKGCADCRE